MALDGRILRLKRSVNIPMMFLDYEGFYWLTGLILKGSIMLMMQEETMENKW